MPITCVSIADSVATLPDSAQPFSQEVHPNCSANPGGGTDSDGDEFIVDPAAAVSNSLGGQSAGERGSSLAELWFSGGIDTTDAPGQDGGDPVWGEKLSASDLLFGLADGEMEMEGTSDPPLMPGSPGLPGAELLRNMDCARLQLCGTLSESDNSSSSSESSSASRSILAGEDDCEVHKTSALSWLAHQQR
jgi:hypothetical protein